MHDGAGLREPVGTVAGCRTVYDRAGLPVGTVAGFRLRFKPAPTDAIGIERIQVSYHAVSIQGVLVPTC